MADKNPFIGKALFTIGLLTWMSVSVGPWYIGALLFTICMLITALEKM